MSLVLEALRRVEKSDARPGSVGVVVASYGPPKRRRGVVLPLLLGLATGVVLIFVARPQTHTVTPRQEAASRETTLPRVNHSVSAAMPESPALQTGPRPATPSEAPAFARAEKTKTPGPAISVRPPLILQAISERDSRPIAVINDQLVREGDLFEGARILRIGAESVDVRLENGKAATVRFAPPPPEVPSPTPDSR